METKSSPQQGSRFRSWMIPGAVLLLLVAALVPVAMRWGRQAARGAQARAEVAQLTVSFQRYFAEYHAVPAGSPAQIMAALAGNNARKIKFFEADPARFGPAGLLLDPWQTPYKIDLTDPEHPKAYSFGPNMRDEDGG